MQQEGMPEGHVAKNRKTLHIEGVGGDQINPKSWNGNLNGFRNGFWNGTEWNGTEWKEILPMERYIKCLKVIII